MFVTLTRKLPECEISIAVNPDTVIWAQPADVGYTTLFMVNGPEVIVKGSLVDVKSTLDRS
jgi:hypothetical protein